MKKKEEVVLKHVTPEEQLENLKQTLATKDNELEKKNSEFDKLKKQIENLNGEFDSMLKSNHDEKEHIKKDLDQ